MPTSAKCVTCGAMFSGYREEAFQWLWYHRTLHELQATAVETLTADRAAEPTPAPQRRKAAQVSGARRFRRW